MPPGHASPRFALALFAALWLAGCGSGSEGDGAPAAQPTPAAQPAPAAPSAAARAEAEQIFVTRCTTCHGSAGVGDGPASAGLSPKPRNLQDASWQGSVSDEHIEQIVLYGGAAVGKSPTMPGNPDLMAKPEVLAALRARIRSLGGR